MSFTVPPDAETYVSVITQRAESLVEAHIWSNLTVPRIREWFANFRTKEERYFGACILDSLVYRSDEQTQSLILELFQRHLPDLTHADPSPLGAIDNWLERLRNEDADPCVRLVPVIRSNDPPTKSGPLVLRVMKRSLDLSEKWMIWPWQVSGCMDKVKIFLFVDDFLGTGYQFRKFVSTLGLKEVFEKAYCVYCPLVGHVSGIGKLRTKYSTLRLESVETIDNSVGVFDPASTCFLDGVNTPEGAKAFYREMMKSRGIKLAKVLGYGNFGLSFAFRHATPNASLPILWIRHKNWYPLFDR